MTGEGKLHHVELYRVSLPLGSLWCYSPPPWKASWPRHSPHAWHQLQSMLHCISDRPNSKAMRSVYLPPGRLNLLGLRLPILPGLLDRSLVHQPSLWKRRGNDLGFRKLVQRT
ncbi:hypothetical protein HRR90_005749 [Exophiala dermatitidis]|uniref:Uncharacterized protein n=1 Tax=Exophiala dermatitidis TaxID=5970 RepID=A0AAN6EYQ8_EXODE|nr:hypothetical protein HRR74_004125 [Exophiala dermatitidis]KAJ4529198.1 hypothetical protein HRR73_000220 [Exophiala dermatitidis]KAJ4544156.1 hypothetical protein HRR76_002222 [Exophiala dermatitidis]KAJ4549337.1 hypothetical protein HRR77_004202 [Exophiala dermatitidis]KAJ4582575.1 hypothetical protein HRR81_001303 [Exophiala dermatitidis]